MASLVLGLAFADDDLPRINREGLFQAIEMGGLSDRELAELIRIYGVDFRISDEEERRLAAKAGSAVVTALKASYRGAEVPAGREVLEPQGRSQMTPAAPVRRVYPHIPAGLTPFVKSGQVVRVKVQVDEGGRVTGAQIVSFAGPRHDLVTRMVLESAQKWMFTPARKDGRPVACEQVIHFTL